MRKTLPLCMILLLVVIYAHAQQPPSLAPNYATHIQTGQGFWITIGTAVSGSQPLTYQWTKDGNVITEDSNFINIERVRPEDAGTYILTATNPYGSVTSEPIVIEVTPNIPPVATILGPRTGLTFTPGEEFSFAGLGTDEEPWHNPSHAWRMEYHNGDDVSPALEPSDVSWASETMTHGYFTIPPDLVPTETSFYRMFLTATDYHGLSHTDSVDIMWSGRLNTTLPEIETRLADVTAAPGSAVTFTVIARLATSYQWMLNGENIPGATDATYEIESVGASDAGTYQVLVSNSAGTVESNEAILRLLNSAPIIQDQPVSQTVTEGMPVTFTVSATDAASFQWKFNGANIQGATKATLAINPVNFSHAGTYSVIVSNDYGNTASNEVQLTVVEDNPPARTSIVTVKTNPANLSAIVDGKVVPTRYAVTSEEGTEYTVAPVSPQTVEGVTYAFSNWAHGGAPTQTITTGPVNSWYTINYSSPLTGRWRTTDVGAVNIHGSAAVDNDTYTLSGSGNDIWGTADAFRFIYQTVYGDVDIRARVTSVGNTHPWAKAGVMVRNSTDRSSTHVMTVLTPNGGSSFQRRTAPKGVSSATNGPAGMPYWVRLVRIGETFTSYVSPDGTTWTMIGAPLAVPMNERVFVGLVVTSHSANQLCTATMTDVSVTSSTGTAAASIAEGSAMWETDSSFELYPNPVMGNTLRIKFSDEGGAGKIQIVNSLGQVFYDHDTTSESTGDGIDVDINSFPRGVYVVRVSDKLKIRTRSFIRN